MHGVPENLDLSMFEGAELDGITLGQFIIHLSFAAPQSPRISVEGHWELRDGPGTLVDQQMEPTERDAYRIHVLLGHAVISTLVEAPNSFRLRFDSGHTLTIFDSSSQYESFSIQPGDIYV